MSVEKKVTVKVGRGDTQDDGRYGNPVGEEREENDVEEEKDVDKKVDTCTQTVKAFGNVVAGVEFQ